MCSSVKLRSKVSLVSHSAFTIHVRSHKLTFLIFEEAKGNESEGFLELPELLHIQCDLCFDAEDLRKSNRIKTLEKNKRVIQDTRFAE